MTGADMSHARAWEDHRSKRRKLSLLEEVAETQTESQRSIFAKGRGKFTDVTVWCGTESWNAHRSILADRCAFFRTCLEGKFKEATTHTIYLDDDDAAAVSAFLEWIYTYSNTIPVRALIGLGRCKTLMHLCRLADKYDQPLLLEQIADTFKTNFCLTTADLLIALHEIDTVGEGLWIGQIRDYIIAALEEPGKLHELDKECEDILSQHPKLACQLLGRLSDALL